MFAESTEKIKNGKLKAYAQGFGEHMKPKTQLGDNRENTPLGLPGLVLCPVDPESPFDTSPPRWCEIRQGGRQDKIRLCTRFEWCCPQCR